MATTLRDTLKEILGSAWHVAHDAFFAALCPASDGTAEANKPLVPDANKDVTGLRNLTTTGAAVIGTTFAAGANATDKVTVQGIYMNPAVVAVAVPSIANDAAENVDSVAVDVAAAFSVAVTVGDAVVAIPMEALPTDCLLLGAYVTATDQITLTFGSKEGGGGVTGANKNFNFLLLDLTA